jgi:ferredoxin-NADP reductase
MNLKLIHKEKIANDSWDLIFEKPEGFSYEAGQFLEINLDHPKKDDRGTKRWFTLSSSPTEGDLMITTRLVEKHSTFKGAFLDLEAGDSIEATGPMGSFILPKEPAKKLVWIAGGIGITPFRSQMKFIMDNQEKRNVTLIYSNRTLGDVCFEDLWNNAKNNLSDFNYIQTLVDEIPSNWKSEKGVVDEAMIARHVGDIENCEFFISGPEPMVEAFKPMLEKMGVKEEDIHQDWFPNYTEKF